MAVETNSHQKQLFVMYHYFLNPHHLHLVTVILISCSIINLEKFFQTLLNEKHYKPTTISEKIRRMKLAIKYIIHAEDSMFANKDLFIEGSRLLEILTQWCLSLSKAIALQRQQHSLTTAERIPLVLDPHEFLESKKVFKILM